MSTSLTTTNAATPLPTRQDPPGRVIIREVAEKAGLSLQQMVDRDRDCRAAAHRSLYVYRCWAMWRLRNELGYTLPQIGRIFGRDHTTVIHAIRKVEAVLSEGREWLPAKQETTHGYKESDRAADREARRVSCPRKAA